MSYNPTKPGRPSHAYHAFLMAGTRLVLDVDVAPGNRHRSKSAAPSLWALLERLGREHWPRLVRGDKDWASEGNMASCEGAGLDYLFKLRLTKGARRLAERLMARDEWEDAGQGWSGIEAELRLQGWSRTRRVVVLRRRLPGTVALTRSDDGQGDLFWADAQPGTGVWEFAVLATSLDLEVRSVAQLYRDRADVGERLRRVEEPVGLGRLHHARPETLPAHGAVDRAHLQLVEPVRALGGPRSPPRGDHQPAASASRDCPPDPPRRSDPADGDIEPWAAQRGGRGFAADHRLLPDPGAKCGAVERRGSLAPDGSYACCNSNRL